MAGSIGVYITGEALDLALRSFFDGSKMTAFERPNEFKAFAL